MGNYMKAKAQNHSLRYQDAKCQFNVNPRSQNLKGKVEPQKVGAEQERTCFGLLLLLCWFFSLWVLGLSSVYQARSAKYNYKKCLFQTLWIAILGSHFPSPICLPLLQESLLQPFAQMWRINVQQRRVDMHIEYEELMHEKARLSLQCCSPMGGSQMAGKTPTSRKRAEYRFGEYGFKQWVFGPSPSSWERIQWVPLGPLFVCQSDLTEFFAELTKFAAELSEFSLRKQVPSKQYNC